MVKMSHFDPGQTPQQNFNLWLNALCAVFRRPIVIKDLCHKTPTYLAMTDASVENNSNPDFF